MRNEILLESGVAIGFFLAFLTIMVAFIRHCDSLSERIFVLEIEIQNSSAAYESMLSELQDQHSTDIARFNELTREIGELEGVVDILTSQVEQLSNKVAQMEVRQEYAVIPSVLTRTGGVAWFEGHKETYYNLPMERIVETARQRLDILADAAYTTRADGVKMIGDYVIVAADQSVHPYGSIVNTSLGEGIVLDTGTFIFANQQQIDIATNW